MQSGDVLVVLFGGIVPFILRPLIDGRWKFVGECFVPSLMQGEAVEAAGMFVDCVHERSGNGELRFLWGTDGKDDPRYSRKIGEHGIRTFELR